MTDELHKHLDCRILARGFAHLYCAECGQHHVVAFETGAATVIQRATVICASTRTSTLFLDGVYGPDGDGQRWMLHPAGAPSQADIEQFVGRASRRILRFLQRRGIITPVTAPGDAEPHGSAANTHQY